MIETLTEAASLPAQRAALIKEIVALVETRVKAVKGLSGMAIRGGYKVVASMRGGRMIPSAVNVLLNDFCIAIDPFIADYRTSNAESFERYLTGRDRAVSEALLSITDARAEHANALLKRPYKKLRSFGEAQVIAAVPGIAQIVERTLFTSRQRA